MNKVTKADLTGEIADFPKRVVQAMCDEQVRQGNPFNPSVFSANKIASKREGGFNWADTEKGRDFWPEIIDCRNFDLIHSPKAHPHADLIRQYAEDCINHDNPWELWEVRSSDKYAWSGATTTLTWNRRLEYRRKPEPKRMITVGSISFPASEIEAPKVGASYYAVGHAGEVDSAYWGNDMVDKQVLAAGNLWLNEDDAKAAAVARAKINRGEF